MSNKNSFNLDREIPADIKRIVRQRCGFGCVVCGSAIYQYDHFEPEFKDASEHRAEGITLLCGGCHDKKTKTFLSKETVAEANNNPCTLKKGFSSNFFDVDVVQPTIFIGNIELLFQGNLIVAGGLPILNISPPMQPKTPFLISGIFSNDKGQQIFSIAENEFRSELNNWDVEVKGSKITIRQEHRKITLIIKQQGRSRLIIDRLDMRYGDHTITGGIGKSLICSYKGIPKITMGLGSKLHGAMYF